MKRFLTAAALALAVLYASPAEARRHPPAAKPVAGTYFSNGLRSFFDRLGRGVSDARRAAEGRPAGCPHAWCGCWLMHRLGITDRRYWQARAWAGFGSKAGGPGADVIAVWPHHVGLIRAVDGRRILLLSGNDGHAVRERWRSVAGIIAYRVRG